MRTPFIRNHQLNLIKKQVGQLQQACTTVSDPKVIESVRSNAPFKVMEAFPGATEAEQKLLGSFASLNTPKEFQSYLQSLEDDMLPFEKVEEKQLKKLFPKVKKLKVPDLAAMDLRYVTYLGWTDIAANKMFLVYRLNDRLVGVEGRFTPVQKKSVCFLCNRHEEVALFSAVTKSRPANASPDYYKAIGNYMCVNSETCNKNITNVTMLERFISDIVL
ncbi:FusB/FusC family EF-G-binding protein [Paenibacillus glycanilyticus]|uniref:FusB/FusC family EF-G-binding protein n=1 Tax=Paenibacillus glycanilyticus TaxID=126569 RepID=UPI00203F0427|nr:FusB/FusC family EF-G-binding protein [Paenibacillus glycanilyticus]MCM3631283.1 FusB/FusC family EF-G-binding protein [Paenibacillus glycanilyticus]